VRAGTVIALLVAVASTLVATRARAGALDEASLPRCWSVTSSVEAGAAAREEFGKRFGVEVQGISNYKIDAGGIPLQVNAIRCSDRDDAAKVHDFFMTAQNADELKYVQDGAFVYEFLCDNRGVLGKIQDVMGVYPHYDRAYKVTMEVAPLSKSDDMSWNDLFNALVQQSKNPDDTDAVEQILTLGPRFEFADRIVLRDERPEWGAPVYAFSVAPESEQRSNDLLEVTFADLPRLAGVPRVTIEATVPVRAYSPYVPREPVNAYNLTRATDPWPTNRREFLAAFEGDWDPTWPTMKKIEYIQCWVFQNIKYGGDEVGSRYGVVKTFEQRYGHCWDKSDVFVALCRRAEIPAREVMGWHVGFKQGHVWAQAYDEASGWISVDATASWIGVDELYIPLFILEQGHTPFVYASIPEVTLAPLPKRK
jgi:transglutaminase-like putative cysteine protease